MVPYDASASVPMVIYDGRPGRTLPARRVVDSPTQLIDIFPTILELAEVEQDKWPKALDGHSLVPLIGPANAVSPTLTTTRPDFVVSQFHGDNIAMSWFLIVQQLNGTAMKLIVWGTGAEVPSLLFDLEADPMENTNLIATPAGKAKYAAAVALLDRNLRSVVDYPAVALDVAAYGQKMFRHWMSNRSDWENEIHKKGLRWDPAYDADVDGSLAAIHAWLAEEPKVKACRLSLSHNGTAAP